VAVVHKVFQNLLRERVSIRDAVSILEALGEGAMSTRNHVLLTEYVRQAIRRAIVAPFLNGQAELPAFLIDPSVEETVTAGVTHGEQSSHINLSPKALRDVLTAVQRSAGNPSAPTPVLASAGIRFFMQQICEASFRNLFFLSHNEIPPSVRVMSLGVIQ
jgi:flagellar biosynthesis protein FlhA